MAVMRNGVLCKGLWSQRFLEPQHGLLRPKTNSIPGNDHRVQPPDTNAKQQTKRCGAQAVFVASLWCLLSTSEDLSPTTSALDITALTRCCTPASTSQSAEPFGVAMGDKKTRAPGPFCLRRWNFIDSVGKFSSTAEYRITLKALDPTAIRVIVIAAGSQITAPSSVFGKMKKSAKRGRTG